VPLPAPTLMPPPVPTAVPLPAPCRACADGRVATNADQRPSCLLRRCLCLFHCQPLSSSPEEVASCSSRALRERADAGASPSADSHATSSANGCAASCAVRIPALTVVPLFVPTAVPFHAHADCRTTSGADGRGGAGPDCRHFQYQRPSYLLRRCSCHFQGQQLSSTPEKVAMCSSRALREWADAGASPNADSHAASSANGRAAFCAVPVPALTVVPLLVPTAVPFHAHADCRSTSGANGRGDAGPDCRHFQYQRPSCLLRRCSCLFQSQPLSTSPEKVAMCASRALRE
jgi:hypothetical protein